ncbi:TonB-dependent receptor-like protein [Mucilaginibacter frigoritolerans]|uniref:TonB-dependent receptor-like protein n=1 Tax=Mucilaginibacter frigoritolerans TaxID=652788 RepID=A0A562TU44_9SPHI|nr:TonB-dependent receptor-like protein [Mucilaginibacter frigoritolerans]
MLFLQMAWAQQTTVKLISGDFHQATITQFVNDIESKSNYHFYYDPAGFDSLKITLQVNNKPLETILDMAFSNTDFHYAIDENKVFLTKGRQIKTELAPGFSAIASQTVVANQSSSVADYTVDKEKKIPEATTENKLYEIGNKTNNITPGNSVLSGYIRDIKSGEAVVGASIYLPSTKAGVATDQFGYYSITMPRGRNILVIRGLGMRDTRRQIILYTDGKLNIELQEQVNTLKEVKISADKVANVRSAELGVSKLTIATIKQIPAAFGEADVLRVVLTLPGVKSVGEATTGFNVRGGAADENLILLDGATIYNPAHFFGFFAAFNPDIVKDIELYKSSIPEKYGGRLSSVLEINNREGNKKIFTGSAGIGLLTSRFNIEGPIIKDKTSFIFGARTTYSDWLLNLLPEAYKHSSASFNDFNLGISHQIDDKNNIYLTGYLSNDKFKLNSDTQYSYSNKSAVLKWKHNFNNKLYSVVSAGVDRYQYDVSSTVNPVNAFDLGFKINQSNFRADFTYYINNKHTLDFGVNSILYKINPGTFEPDGPQSLIIPQVVPAEQALESGIYLGDKYDVSSKLTINAGVRFNVYNYLGPQTVDQYAPNLPKEPVNVLDSTTYKSGKIINTYSSPDIRLSARYLLSDDLSLKAGYNTMHQYIHLLTNSTSISPTDVYKLSDPNIKPEHGDQVSLGLFKNAKQNTIELSVEVYYKRLRDYLDYKSGAVLLLNEHIEQDVINTQGKAYGAEFLIKKTAGKLNGWFSYTYSRTFLKQDDPNAGELINNGAYYPANWDEPHAFNFTGNYKFTHRYSISLDLNYNTGRPITLPIAKYEYAGSERVFYSDRNEYRIPYYFRSDFSINIEGNHRVHQRTHNSWTIGVYNLTGRQNAYSTFFTEQSGVISGYKLSIFASPIPFINYNIRF